MSGKARKLFLPRVYQANLDISLFAYRIFYLLERIGSYYAVIYVYTCKPKQINKCVHIYIYI